ncbi:MAG TPA: hypothetical protein VMD91_10550 [Candidatus Sulfotelmatobacter sp.]|nr:hypothetical protein [Candidatus Sulfotelmatobacter sp.]
MPVVDAAVYFDGCWMRVETRRAPFEPAQVEARINLDDLNPLTPRASAPELFELLDLLIAVYALDRSVSRPADGWAREFNICFPVYRVEDWRRHAPLVREWLFSLTGDFVEVAPMPRTSSAGHHGRPPSLDLNGGADVIGLLSDGLDSLCGIDTAVRDRTRRLALASVITSDTRGRRIDEMARWATAAAGYDVEHLRLRTKLRRKPRAEKTQRSRTVLALVTGLTAASALGAKYVESYENGIGVLNLPVPDLQYGTMSTQVLQPRYLPIWDRIARAFFGADIRVRYPNRFSTKGEMVAGLSPEASRLVRDGTFSCDAEHRANGHILHCGSCGSCRYRQLSLASSGMPIVDAEYVFRKVKEYRADPLNMMRYHADLLAEALSEADPWSALLRLQPELCGVDSAEYARGGDAADAWRVDAREHTIELLRRHVREVQGWRVASHAA